MKKFFLLNIFILSFIVASFATDEKIGKISGLPLPRYAVLKAKEVNMRGGPGIDHPIKITYGCIFAPIKILNEVEAWRLVSDVYGNQGWIHEAMLDGKKYVQISGNNNDSNAEFMIFRLPNKDSKPIARVQNGIVMKLVTCNELWCKVKLNQSYSGWVLKNNLWGIS